MKKFEVPTIRVKAFAVEDVVTASSNEGGSNENQTPMLPPFGQAITPKT